MKTLFKSLQVLIISCVFFSCNHQIPISKVTPENNKTYQVDFLFEYEGCKVYRFLDYGDRVYFTNCNGNVTSIKSDSTEIRTINVIRQEDKK